MPPSSESRAARLQTDQESKHSIFTNIDLPASVKYGDSSFFACGEDAFLNKEQEKVLGDLLCFYIYIYMRFLIKHIIKNVNSRYVNTLSM